MKRPKAALTAPQHRKSVCGSDELKTLFSAISEDNIRHDLVGVYAASAHSRDTLQSSSCGYMICNSPNRYA